MSHRLSPRKLREAYRASRAFRWSVDLSAFLLAMFILSAWQSRHHLRGPAPQYTFTTLEQEQVTLGSFSGKPTLMVVWAPWCGVCKVESGNVSLAKSWLGSRANVVSVATAFAEVEEVRRYMAAQKVDYPVLLADDDFARLMHVEAFPTAFVLDSQGRIVSSMQGYSTTLGLFFRTLWAD